MKRYCKITTDTSDVTFVTELSEPWILLDKSENNKDNFILQRSINNLTLDLLDGYNIEYVQDFVDRDPTHALMCIQNKDNTYTVIYKKEKTELSPDYPDSIYKQCKSIILPNSITKINPETFKDCSNLENITLPNSISEIGDGAFYGCKNLTTIKITNNIHYISKTAFNGCTGLTEIILYNELTNNEKHYYTDENGKIYINYYDENCELKHIVINIDGSEALELHALTPKNNTILYKTHSGNIYDFDDGTNTSYVKGYTINSDGSHSSSTKLDIVDNIETNGDIYRIYFPENTNISKISGFNAVFKQFFYFESDDLTEIYLPISVTDINNCVFDTPNLSTLLLPPNISLNKCKLPDDKENGEYNRYVEVLHNCGKLKNILYNGTSKEFNKIIETASSTWYKDLPYKFTVTCLDEVLNRVNNFKSELITQNDNEILYKAPLVANMDYTINRVSTSIYITTSGLTPTNDDYNILQFDYTSSKKKLNGYYEPSTGQEFYCLQSDAITELVLPNGIEEIDALAFNCPNLTTITLPNSIKRFKTVRYTDVLSADLETVNRTLIFGSNIKTIYFDGTEYEWNAIDKNLNWNPAEKPITVICRDKEFNIESGDDTPYQMVDLGLPSGLIWADRNVGAETPQDNGLYFSWGNIEGHAVDENGNTMYGYSFDRNTYNETLGSQYTGSELAVEYDAATANMGGEWHMPTIENISELVENTNHYYIDADGNTVVESELSSSKKLRSICFVKKGVDFNYNNRSNFIEFPFAGNCSDSSLYNKGFYGYILSSSIYKSNTNSACCLATLNTGDIYYNGGLNRHLGSPIRGVRGPLEYKMVDLGLPSGLKWADRNVGAETPQDNGLYFDWGNVNGHRVDENGNTIDGYSFNLNTYATTSGDKYTGRTLDAEHDAASVNMSGEWRMPTIIEISELVENTDQCYIDLNGHKVPESELDSSIELRSVCFVKKGEDFNYDKRSNFIEFPFAGFCRNSSLHGDGISSIVWSSSIASVVGKFAHDLYLDSGGYISTSMESNRYMGLSVRGVYAPIEYNTVDLGLSVKWADKNVGAKTPQDNGLYFSWGNVKGHVVGKNGYTIDRYSFDEDTYATTSGSQYTGSTLDAEHDAATVNMGGNWRMPTMDEIDELIESTDKRYIDEDGNILNKSQLNGSIKLSSICFVKPGENFDYNDRSNFIEIPFTGCCLGSLLNYEGESGMIWMSSSVHNGSTQSARILYFDKEGNNKTLYSVYYSGLSVRGVYTRETFEYQEIITEQNKTIEKLNQQNQSLQESINALNLNNQQLTEQNTELNEQIESVTSKTFSSNGTFTASSEGVLGWDEITINVAATENPEENQSGYQMVDLGLPTGIKWADRNVGAENPWDNGEYFSWGNIIGHTVDEDGNTTDNYSFDSDTYSTTTGGQYTGSELDADHDAATAIIGSNWRIPTIEEIRELVEYTEHYYIGKDGSILGPFDYTINYSDKGLDGSIELRSICFVKKDTTFDYNVRGNFIEFPFAGKCSGSLLSGNGFWGRVWSNYAHDSKADMAHILYFNNEGHLYNGNAYGERYLGISVRGVYVGETTECSNCSGYLETIEKLEDEKQQLEEEKQRLVTENTNLNGQITEKNTTIEILNGQIAQKDTTIANLNNDNQELTNKNTELNGQIAKQTNEINELKDKNNQLTDQNDDLSEKIESVTSRTFNSNGTFTAEDEGVLGWNEITINITETPEDPEVPEDGGDTEDTTSTITKVEVKDDNGMEYTIYDTTSTDNIHQDEIHISQSDGDMGLYTDIYIYGTNLLVNGKYNFTFNGNSTHEGIYDPNNTSYWIPYGQQSDLCRLESSAPVGDGITLTYPFVNPGTLK